MKIHLSRKDSRDGLEGGRPGSCITGYRNLFCAGLTVTLLALGSPAFAQSVSYPFVSAVLSDPRNAPANASLSNELQSDQQSPASICGEIVDKSGTAVAGADIKLSRADQSEFSEAQSGSDGQFCVSNVPAGAFQLTVSSDGFAPQNFSGIVQPGQTYMAPNIVLSVASVQTELRVAVSPFEVAEQQIKDEEKQRVLGVIPMFYVSYVPDAVSLRPKQKFELAWKTLLDPFSFGLAAATAGIEQGTNDFSGYGRGAQGYAKRFGAAYGDDVTSTMIGGAILPILLKQDPRYFYKGTGSFRSRFFYAIANSVICKGDNKRWQPNYSGILGDLAASGISNLYYPPENRDGVQLTFENALIGIGESAAFNVIQEFIFPKLTSHRADRQAAKSSADLSAE